MALGTPSSPSGVVTRPVRRVSCGCEEQSGRWSQSGPVHPVPEPATHRAGSLMPPMQRSFGDAHCGLAGFGQQLSTPPQPSGARPQVKPISSHVVGVQGGVPHSLGTPPQPQNS